MPVAQTPPQPKPESQERKYSNFIWWLVTVVLLTPALLLAYHIVSQPEGNRIHYDINRPDVGAGFNIQYAAIEQEQLKLTVSYQGGCSDHIFDLYIEDQQSDINRTLELYHKTDDTCDTRVTEDLSYDIASVIAEHDSEQIVFTITGNGAEPDPILFKKPPSSDDLTTQ